MPQAFIRIRTAARLSVAAAVLTWAAPVLAQEQPLVIARHLEINSLDPSRAFCDTCQIYLSSTYQGLVKLGADNKSIEPLLASDLRHRPEELVRQAVRANIRVSASQLRHGSQLLEHLTQEKGLLVVGAEYSLETGVVDFFDGAGTREDARTERDAGAS